MTRHLPEDELLITDPEKQPGVILEVPPGTKAIGLLDVGYQADHEVRCSFCPPRRKHKKGSFAILPDNMGLALIGHCCAEEVDKAAVAQIERRTERLVAEGAKRRSVDALMAGVAEVLEIIDRDYLPQLKQVDAFAEETGRIVWLGLEPTFASSLGLGRGGLVSLLERAKGDVSDKDVPMLLDRKNKAFDAIRKSLADVEARLASLSVNHIRSRMDRLKSHNEVVSLRVEGRSVVVQWWDPIGDMEYLTERAFEVPEIFVPDQSEIMRLLDGHS